MAENTILTKWVADFVVLSEYVDLYCTLLFKKNPMCWMGRSVYTFTYFMLCKSLDMCITNENYFWLLFTSFCHKSIMLQHNISASVANMLKFCNIMTKQHAVTSRSQHAWCTSCWLNKHLSTVSFDPHLRGYVPVIPCTHQCQGQKLLCCQSSYEERLVIISL